MSKKWLVRVPVHADALVRVDAASKEEAIDKATNSLHEILCPHCAARLCPHCANSIEIGDLDQWGEVTAEEQP